MADIGAVEAMLQGLPEDQGRRTHREVWKRVLPDLRFGRAIPAAPAKNFGGGFFSITTPSTPDTEFVLPHRFGTPPYLLIPVLPLDTVGATIVPIAVTRAADSNNVYLSSSEASAVVYFYLEG